MSVSEKLRMPTDHNRVIYITRFRCVRIRNSVSAYITPLRFVRIRNPDAHRSEQSDIFAYALRKNKNEKHTHLEFLQSDVPGHNQYLEDYFSRDSRVACKNLLHFVSSI